MATTLLASPDKRRYEEEIGDLCDAMTDIYEILSIPSSDSFRKHRAEEVNYKDGLRSMASAMTGIKTHMERQNNLKLLKLKAEADLIVLLEAPEANMKAVRSKPNPTPTQ